MSTELSALLRQEVVLLEPCSHLPSELKERRDIPSHKRSSKLATRREETVHTLEDLAAVVAHELGHLGCQWLHARSLKRRLKVLCEPLGVITLVTVVMLAAHCRHAIRSTSATIAPLDQHWLEHRRVGQQQVELDVAQDDAVVVTCVPVSLTILHDPPLRGVAPLLLFIRRLVGRCELGQCGQQTLPKVVNAFKLLRSGFSSLVGCIDFVF